MQEKTNNVASTSAQIGFIIHKDKTKILKTNVANINTITVEGEELEEVKAFTYLGSVTDEQGGKDAGVRARISKACAAFVKLRNV